MIRATIGDVDLRFETAPGLFSPDAIDVGTAAMLAAAGFSADDKVLDLGCGYGVVGIYAACVIGPEAVFMIDKDPAAVAASVRNARLNDVEGVTVALSDGFNDFRETGFTRILSNPPFHADFAVPKHFIEKGFNRLVVGGELWMVTRRRDWYVNKLTAIFGGVKVTEAGGYFVFQAVKKRADYATKPKR